MKEAERKRTRLVNARLLNYSGFDAVYWRVARILEDEANRDLSTQAFIEAYLKCFPSDANKGAIAEAIRRYRADLQNIVAPDIYPHSPNWRRQSERHQEASKEFFSRDAVSEKREELKEESRTPFPELLKPDGNEFKLVKWVPKEEFDKILRQMLDRGYRYAGSGVWRRHSL